MDSSESPPPFPKTPEEIEQILAFPELEQPVIEEPPKEEPPRQITIGDQVFDVASMVETVRKTMHIPVGSAVQIVSVALNYILGVQQIAAQRPQFSLPFPPENSEEPVNDESASTPD